MSLSITEQITKLLEGKKHALVTFRPDGKGDAVGSALALVLFLKKNGIRSDIVVDGFALPTQFAFLPGADRIQSQFSHLQQFIITVDISRGGVKELSYDVQDQHLRIFITPKSGFFTREHIRTAQSDFKYDIIFTVNTQDRESLGGMYDNNTQMFYKLPLVNIDHKPDNARFGDINLVDVTATTTAEVVYQLLKTIDTNDISEEIATALLTAIISETHSFREDTVKPHTLMVSSELVKLGGDRDMIVRHLFRTRSIATLKLWGEALVHMQNDPTIHLVWSTLTRDDFARTGAKETDLHDIIQELISNSPEAKVIVLFYEAYNGDGVRCVVHTKEQNINATALLHGLNPKGNGVEAKTHIKGKNLKQVEEDVLLQIRKILREEK